ncbi:MAG: ABC transporter permease, partial [Gemmiger sp.]|nr:ABC transporter permease [Gemmiger sp.]
MLKKLSLGNAKRQARDYSIYFITLVISLSLVHGLNALLFSKDDIFPRNDTSFRLLMVVVSVFLVCILAWLTNYMTHFILKCRSKEIAIYITIGMEPRQISGVFLAENFYISGVALLLSFVGGSFVYQVLKAVSFHLVGKKYAFALKISALPFLLTVLYFLLTYGIAAFRSLKVIRKLQPVALLQYDTPHKTPARILKQNALLFTPLSILCLISAVFVMVSQPLGGGKDVPLGLSLSLLFIFLFFHYFPSWVTLVLERGVWRYRPVRLLVLRSFTSKMQSMRNVLSFLAGAFTVSLFFISMVSLSITTYNYRLALVPFSFSVITGQGQGQEHLAAYQKYIQKSGNAHADCYTIYKNDITTFSAATPGSTFYNAVFTSPPGCDLCISYSDYTALRQFLGYPPVTLGQSGYLLHCLPALQGAFEQCAAQNPSITLGGQALGFAGVYTEPLDQYDGYANGAGVLLVLPDAITRALPPYFSKCSVLLDATVTADKASALYQEMQAAFPALVPLRHPQGAIPAGTGNTAPADYMDIREDIRQANGVLYATSALPALYVAMILAIAGFTVIA